MWEIRATVLRTMEYDLFRSLFFPTTLSNLDPGNSNTASSHTGILMYVQIIIMYAFNILFYDTLYDYFAVTWQDIYTYVH